MKIKYAENNDTDTQFHKEGITNKMNDLQFNSDTHVMINDTHYSVLVVPKETSILRLDSLEQIRQRSEIVAIKEKFDFEGYNQALKKLNDAQNWIQTLHHQLSMDDKEFSSLLASNQATDEASSIRLAKNIRSNQAHYKQSQEDVLSDISKYAAMRKENTVDPILETHIHKLLNPKLGKQFNFRVENVITRYKADQYIRQEDAFQKQLLDMITQLNPAWLYQTNTGKWMVVEQELGEEILREIPQVRYLNNMGGAYWNPKLNRWCLNDRSAYVDKCITEKLKDHRVWNTRTLQSVRQYIRNMSYDEEASADPFLTVEPRFINFLNGVYDFESDRLMPHEPEYYLTQERAFELDTSHKQPTNTLKWLEALVQDEDTVTFLCEMIGYFYYRTYQPFQSIFLLHGSGNNGKSVFIEHIKKMLHATNVSNVMLQDLDSNVNRFARAQLFQKEVNLFADIDARHITTTGILKMLTGGDTIMAEKKNENGFSFVNHAKLLFSANTLPTFTDATEGFHRRIEVIPFNTVIDDAFIREHDIKEVEMEIPQFSYYCLRAFKAARDRNSFTRSDGMKEKKKRWIDTMDVFDRFLLECCDVLVEEELLMEIRLHEQRVKGGTLRPREKDKAVVQRKRLIEKYGQSTKELYDYFKRYCEEETAKPIGKQKFKERMQGKGIQVQRRKIEGKNVERYQGVFISEEKVAQLGYDFSILDLPITYSDKW